MTTTVVISSPRPNHQRVRVAIGALDADRNFIPGGHDYVLGEGESTVVYVHDGAAFVITEAPKAATVPH
jgi:hypothetical protein